MQGVEPPDLPHCTRRSVRLLACMMQTHVSPRYERSAAALMKVTLNSASLAAPLLQKFKQMFQLWTPDMIMLWVL